MTRVAVMAIAAALLVATAGARAETRPGGSWRGVPDVTLSYYAVTGRTPAALRASMNRLRPTDANDGMRVDALSRFDYRWRWPGNGKGGCDLSRVELDFRGTVLLPRPADPARLSRATRARWERYVAALQTHEAGHLANAYAARAALREAIAGATCATANAAGAAILARITQADIAYDRRTGHGQAQGAVFP